MVMSVRYAVPYDDDLLSEEPRWQEQTRAWTIRAVRVIRVVRVIREPRWCVPGSLLASGSVAAWMMVALLKHVPLGL
jgi:hypothetical protein